MGQDKIKQRLQLGIVSASAILLCAKFLAFYLTNSVGILTDAMESIVNVTAGIISLYSLYVAAKPKDKEHPFGHGKIELISASFEGLLIMIAGGVIIYEGVVRLFEPAEIEKLDIGILLVAIAGVINYLLGWYSIRMGKKHTSIALIAGGKHLQSDSYSSVGLVAGLLLLYFTKIGWIDSALALIFGSIILFTGIGILRKTVANLVDKADKEVLAKMVEVISKNRRADWIDIHNMKIIKYGSHLYVDCDVTLPWYYSVIQSHEACEELETLIDREFEGQVTVCIHSDPCLERYCEHCSVEPCAYRKKPCETQLRLTLGLLTESDEERKE